MAYDPLPDWEQVRKPKELPKWWYEIESASVKPEAERIKKATNKYAGLPGLQAVLCCLKDAKSTLRFRQIVNTLDRQESSVASWLHRLQENGRVTYEMHDNSRYWRLSRPGETSQPLTNTFRHGPIQRQILALLKPNQERWFSPSELLPLLGIRRVNKIIQSLQSLAHTGELVQRLDPARCNSDTRRHPYQYRWSDVK